MDEDKNEELTLPQQEFELLRLLKDSVTPVRIDNVASKLNTDVNSLMRSIAELENLGLIRVNKVIRKIIELTEEGRKYLEVGGLPEVRLVRVLVRCGCKPSINEIPSIANKYGISLMPNEVNYAISTLSRLGVVRVNKGVIEPISQDKLNNVINRQDILNQIKNEVFEDEVPESIKSIIQEFLRRNIVRVRERSVIELSITDKARDLMNRGLIKAGIVVTALTPELITSGAWRNVVIKRFDLSIPTPQAPIVTKHFFSEFLKFVKEVFISLGFEEVYGPHIELELWNFDALFQAQDHPAREIHDTYFLKYPSTGKILDGELMNRIARTHEDGG